MKDISYLVAKFGLMYRLSTNRGVLKAKYIERLERKHKDLYDEFELSRMVKGL